jgi:transposase
MHSAELKETALALIADGKPHVEVARELEISPSTLASWKAAAGKKRKPKRTARGSADKFELLRARAVELRARGKTEVQIAAKLGVSKSTAHRWSAKAEAEAKPKAKPKPAPGPAPKPTADPPVAAHARYSGPQPLVGARFVDPRVAELQTRMEAVTIERDALRRALDRIIGGA